MTEDETFIRAIVDTPGDDTPRLVYADWLDDRADPRGAYLRTEMEWARPWRDGRLPGDASAVSARASGLNPVWLGRVSRPPLGVCLTTPLFRRLDTPLASDEAVDVLAEELGIVFPPAYRAFLLNYNGGWVDYWSDGEPSEANEVLGDAASAVAYARTLFARCHQSNRRCGLFPVGGMAGASGHVTMIGVGYFGDVPGRLFGGVFHVCDTARPWVEGGRFVEVEHWDCKAADSLPALFAEWEWEAAERTHRN